MNPIGHIYSYMHNDTKLYSIVVGIDPEGYLLRRVDSDSDWQFFQSFGFFEKMYKLES